MIESANEFIRLVSSEDPGDRRRAAWEDAPVSVWRSVVENYDEMRFWVAHNRTVPPEILRILVNDDDWRVRDRVASKRRCPPEILALLSEDSHDAVLSTVAGHPNTPTDVLVRLSGHSWSGVRDKAQRQLLERDARRGGDDTR